MKPSRKNRNSAYYRHHRYRIVHRKKSILEMRGWCVKNEQFGRMAKGKVHCSCRYCSEKTRKIGLPWSQRVQFEGLLEQLRQFERVGVEAADNDDMF